MSHFEITTMLKGEDLKFKKDAFKFEWLANINLAPHRSKGDSTWISMFKKEENKIFLSEQDEIDILEMQEILKFAN